MLFIKDSYLKEFDAKIIKINGNKILLDQTAFYAKSGGQPGDMGVIIVKDKIINIIDTIYDNEKNIIHICEDNIYLDTNTSIRGNINWKTRYKHMKMHTALHLLCSIIPFDVTGGHIGFEKSRLDFNADESMLKKEEIEERINQLVLDNIGITYEWITNEELDKNPDLVRTMSVKPPRTQDKIRLVKIGKVDLQPCGGTHVKSTLEIGRVSIVKIENKGKMNRRINLSIND